ncbi:MAG: DUF512 domain-containing protein, partial [Clostridia bacterium]|nr:DUF512 domain-containing protein [Clostridia bacterium]
IKMHISPINISVHTTNPELRVKMMSNKNAGNVLKYISRLNGAGIKMNCQLVLCPEYNDGKELERTLFDLTELENVECIAAVPVGLTKYRDGLTPLKPFDKISAENVLKIIDKYGDKCIEKYGDRRCYGADEFYLLAQKKIPDAEYYGDFLQLENGVGLWALLKSEAEEALNKATAKKCKKRKVTIATGVAAYPLISEIAKKCEEKFDFLYCNVYAIKNNFFGERITVAGLVTATDIIDQLKGEDLGEELIIPSCMLRSERDMFLDGVTVAELSDILNTNVAVSDNGGYELIYSILGE